MAQEGLLAVVMVFRLVRKAPVKTAQGEPGELRADRPAGEGARGFLDIVLAVVAHPHGEQLQQLPSPVFVNGAAMIAVVVQPEDRGSSPARGGGTWRSVAVAQAGYPPWSSPSRTVDARTGPSSLPGAVAC